jgi:hypothetical protein
MRRTLADVVFFGGVTTCFALAGYRIYFVGVRLGARSTVEFGAGDISFSGRS